MTRAKGIEVDTLKEKVAKLEKQVKELTGRVNRLEGYKPSSGPRGIDPTYTGPFI